MASNTSTCSESPCDIDFSVISTSIQMGHKMIDQILHGIHYGSDEARHLLREECDFILECKVCRNLFRSFANFVAHKRVYCSDTVEEKIEKEKFATSPMEDEAVVIQPEDPDVTNVLASNVDNTKQNVINVKDSVIKKVIDRTFEGKSKDYQLYTKVAENVVKKKALRTRHSMTLTSIDSNPNAMIVNHHKGNKSTENIASGKNSSPHKLSLPNKPDLDSKFKRDGSPKKNTLSDICALLANKKSKESNVPLRTAATNAWVGSLSGRSRKSSPKKAPEFIGMKEVKKGKDKQSRAVAVNTTDSDLEEWTNENEHTNNKPKLSGSNNNVDKSWMKICDIENNICRKCDKRFSALHSLKFHAKMKHGSSLVHYSCTECDKSFLHFASLVRHMRTVHRKLRSFIEEMRAKSQKYQHIPSGIESKDDSADLNSNPSTSEDSHPSDMEEKGSRHILPPPERKSLEQMEIDENKTSKSVDSSPRESTHKLQGKLLPYATGWKKCDRCDKVFWKAKSYSKHYNSCKRKTAKSGENMDRMRTQESSSTVNKTEPGEMEYDEQKVKRFVVANIDAKRTEALSKLKEKLMVAKHLKKKAIVNAGLKDGKSGLGSQSKILTRMSSTNQKSKVSDNSTLYKALTEERSKLRTFYRVQADREINSDESDRKDMQNHEDNNLITSTRTRHQQVHFGHEQTEKNNTIIMRTKQPTQAEAIPGLMVKTVNSTRTRNQQAHSEHGKETFVNTRTKHQQTYSEHSQEQSVKAVNTRTRLQQTHSEHAQDHTDKITNTRTKHHPDHSAGEQTNKISTVITQARHQQTHSELSEEQTDKATSVNTQTRLQQYHSEPTQNLSDKTCSVNTRTRLQQNHSELTQDLNDKTSSVNTRTRLQQNHSELTQDLSDITCSVNTRTRHQQNHSEPTQDLSDITCSVNTRTRRQQNHHEPTQDHSEPTQDLSDITCSVNTRTRRQQNHHEPTQDHSEPTQDLSDITSSVNTRTRHQQNHHEPTQDHSEPTQDLSDITSSVNTRTRHQQNYSEATQDHSEPTQDLSDKISYANARLRQHQISPKPDHQHGVSSLSINTMAALEATSHVPLAIQDTPISLAETGGKAKVHTTKHSTQMIKTDNIDKNTEPKGSDECVSSIDGGIPEAPNSDKIQSKEAFELRKLQDRLTREALGKASVSVQSEAFEKDVNTIDTHASLSKLKVSICAKSPRNNDTTCGQTRENENPAERKKYQSSTSSEQTPINSPTRVSQPMYCSSFPNSPTSMNSNSNDGYNSKFKMTVKEMAELVESASLTKFAKDRKKKARNILNNKQSKVKQNLGAALAKPMKKRVMQKNVVVRKIYSTRLSTGGASVKDDKNKRKYRTRLSTEAVEVTTTKDKVNNMTKVIEKEKELTVQPHPVTITTRASRNEFQEPEESLSHETSVEKVTTESSKEQIVIKSKSEVSNSNGKITSLKDADKASDSKKSSNDKSISVNLGKDNESKISSESSEKSEAEHQTENKRLIREMKRLGNSAGLIESNLYTSFSGSLSSSSRDSIKERPNDAKADKKYQSRDMKRLETSAGLVENNLYIVHNESSSTKEPSKQKLNDEYSAKKHLSREMMKLDNTGGMLNVESDHATRDLSREGVEDQTSKIYISREMKRLENSAGLVENKLYSLHDSSSEQQNLKELGTKRLSRERRKPEHFIDFVDSNRLFDTGSSRESSKERFVSKRVKGKGDLGLDSENEAKPAATVNSLRQKMLAARRSLNNSKTIMNTKSPTKSDKMDTKTSKNEFKIENTLVKKEYVESTNELTKIKCKDEKPDKQSEDHAHRTRLATGSIYFDSELLKMSPSKAEKRALSLRNPGNIQGKITTGSKSSLGNKEKVQTSSSTDHKRLSLSPKKASPVNDKKHERRKSDPLGFALTTGVKQCQKCLKKFWKQKNFQAHITGTDCKDVKGTKKKVNKKRSLSQSPGMSDRTHKANDGKISDGLIAKKARVDLLGNTELKVPILTEINTSQKEKPVREPIPVTKTNISAELDNSYGNNINEMADGENAGKDLVQPVNASASDLENISEVYEKTSGTKLYSETTEKSGKTDNDDQCKKGSFHGTMMTDQQPGTSASYLGNNSDDDDTTSEFSGFSENDLKEKDTRFNDIDMNDDYETVDNSDDMFTDDSDDADDGMLAFDCEVDHAMKEVKTIDESGKVAYVEEIWIDKQPGMPVVEKTKNIKNRSYVVDVDNPLKLHCHNIKQVDKLIDENNLKCLQCETACTSISNLRRHVIRHLGWKRYKCKVCMMFACYDMSECRLHLVRTHNEKLSSCNFSRLVCDLKKEATKKRNAKRMDTLRSRKLSGEEPYKKPRQTVFTKSSSQKMTGENDIEANVENDTSLRVSGLNIKPFSGKSEKSERKPDEMSGDNTKKNISQKPTAKEEKSLMTSPVKVTEPSIKEKRDEPKITSPLYKARMNLTNALK